MNLALWVPEHAGRFGCPVCLRICDRTMLSELTRAHIIPRSVGGRLTTLVCRECDSRSGTAFDRHVADEYQLNRWLRGEQSLPVRVTSGDALLTADCRLDGDRLTFEYLASHSTPGAMGAVAAGWSAEPTKVQLPGFNGKRVLRSLIYSAYLMLFRQLGYEYALSEPAARVRQIIGAPVDAEPPWRLVITAREILGDIDPRTLVPSISIVTCPSELACFAIALPSPVEGSDPRCVFLPGFGIAGRLAFERIHALDAIPRLRLTSLPTYERDRLTSAGDKGFFHWMWQEVTQSRGSA
ncbi:MAG: HNH endonuclease [Mycobacterium sp.]